MSDATVYVLDADSFIRSKRTHYGFDFCPGYWDALLASFKRGSVVSIEPVRSELERGKDDLSDWVAEKSPDGFFAQVTDEGVQAAYAATIRNTQANPQYTAAAKQDFARGADPWLVAYAKVSGCVISTYEVASPDSKARIKLPDVASAFGVKCVQPFEMLRSLSVRLVLAKTQSR
ncbi:MAG: DUF4411 family protein [Planctomycetota bacterium]